ncbi:hypothetical protein SeMB42_g03704 [Synchytrium endobioticum]|uniref:Uncharacterized protein n=1 Tax=Synchytrium endobioticum TaxID=286115 RepID=A0A507D583_9FUNG|nr:hypothetical protein SeMB42_g03704 [Synchytrium endobioticum]
MFPLGITSFYHRINHDSQFFKSSKISTTPVFPVFTMSLRKYLFVFDFDWTMIDADSDHWTLKHCSEDLHAALLANKTLQYTDLVAALLREAHARGTMQSDITRYLHTIPFSPAMLESLRLMHARSHDVLILSDANSVFIDEVLKCHGADAYVSCVVTNPACWRDGVLLVHRHTVDPPHGCTDARCGVNLCKGVELDAYLAKHVYDRIVYCGDGANDVCPIRRLGEADAVVYRTGRMLERLLRDDAASAEPQIRARTVLPFSTAEDALVHFKALMEDRPQ